MLSQRTSMWKKVLNDTVNVLLNYIDKIIAKTPDQTFSDNFVSLRQCFAMEDYSRALIILHEIKKNKSYKKFRF